MQIFIETPRLLLREIVEDDAEQLLEMERDPEVHRYIGNNPLTKIEQAQAVIDRVRKQYRKNGIGRWAVIDKASGDFVGWSGLKYEQHIREWSYYDLGYRLKRKYWGQGIATETAVESLKYGFNVLKLPEICAAAHVENKASNAVLQKVGMQLMDTFVFEGEEHNWYVLGKEAWKRPLVLRSLQQKDCAVISEAFKEQGWDKPTAQYETYLKLQKEGKRDIIIAELRGEFAGYLTIKWESDYPPFKEKQIPEIVDFNVLKRFQRRRIGSKLMDEAERRIKKVSKYAGIGFGVSQDYGAAQILYIKRNYIPDGNGLVKDSKPLQYGETVEVNDDLVLYLVKKL